MLSRHTLSSWTALSRVLGHPVGRQVVQLEAERQTLGCQPTLQAYASMKLKRHIAVGHLAGKLFIEAGLLALCQALERCPR